MPNYSTMLVEIQLNYYVYSIIKCNTFQGKYEKINGLVCQCHYKHRKIIIILFILLVLACSLSLYVDVSTTIWWITCLKHSPPKHWK